MRRKTRARLKRMLAWTIALLLSIGGGLGITFSFAKAAGAEIGNVWTVIIIACTLWVLMLALIEIYRATGPQVDKPLRRSRHIPTRW